MHQMHYYHNYYISIITFQDDSLVVKLSYLMKIFIDNEYLRQFNMYNTGAQQTDLN